MGFVKVAIDLCVADYNARQTDESYQLSYTKPQGFSARFLEIAINVCVTDSDARQTDRQTNRLTKQLITNLMDSLLDFLKLPSTFVLLTPTPDRKTDRQTDTVSQTHN